MVHSGSWKKKLSKISHKLQRLNKTSKVTRTEQVPINDDQIHSEDLTASQFAQLTGIKTKRNSSIYYSEYVDSDLDESSDEEDHYLSTATTTSCQSMNIWDSNFWNLQQPNLVKTQSINETHLPSHNRNSLGVSPAVLFKYHSEGPSMIQKGRFKIMWGQDQVEQPQTKPRLNTQNCVEWKRKRTSTVDSLA